MERRATSSRRGVQALPPRFRESAITEIKRELALLKSKVTSKSGSVVGSRGLKKVVRAKNEKLLDFKMSEIVEDVVRSVKSSLLKPQILCLCLFVTAVVVTHETSFETSAIGVWLKEHAATNSLAKWILTNNMKFLGGLIFLPTLYALPSDVSNMMLIGVLAWIFLIPEYSTYEYLVQSFALHTFFRVRQSSTRVFLVVVVAILWFLGIFVFNKPKLPVSATAAKPPTG